MKNLHIAFLSLIILWCIGCGTTSQEALIVSPYYTSTAKIFNLKSGMSLDDVSSTLGIEPYDIYADAENGEKILVYKYRKFFEKDKKYKNTQDYLTGGGKDHYDGDFNLYVYFDNYSKMISFITEEGREDGEKIIRSSHSLQK